MAAAVRTEKPRLLKLWSLDLLMSFLCGAGQQGMILNF
jgi:hypothetical protein